MNVVRVAGLLVYTFGAFAYAALLAMSLSEVRRTPADSQPRADRTTLVGLALWTVSFVWFVINLVIGLLELGPFREPWPLPMVGLGLAYAFPPLIVHITWAEVIGTRSERPAAAWQSAVWVTYALAGSFALARTLGFITLLQTRSDDGPRLALSSCSSERPGTRWR